MERYSTQKKTFADFKKLSIVSKLRFLWFFVVPYTLPVIILLIASRFNIYHGLKDFKPTSLDIFLYVGISVFIQILVLVAYKYRLLNRLCNLLFLKSGKHVFEFIPISLYLKYGIITCLFFLFVNPLAFETSSPYLQKYGLYYIGGLFIFDVLAANFPNKKESSNNI